MANEPRTGNLSHPAQNTRPYDLDKQAIDDLFEEAQQWLDGSAIETETQAEGLERLLKMTREAKSTADANRKIENKPFDEGKAEVQGRYNPLFDRADMIIVNVTKTMLTPWRNKLAQRQREEAEAVRIAAEEASRVAQRVAEVAGSDIGAQEIAAGAEDTARRMQKTADRLTKNAGKGLSMRTVWDHEIVDLKLALNQLYKDDREALEAYVSERMKSIIKRGGEPKFSGVTFTSRKEAY